jgi:hypothetical protein
MGMTRILKKGDLTRKDLNAEYLRSSNNLRKINI